MFYSKCLVSLLLIFLMGCVVIPTSKTRFTLHTNSQSNKGMHMLNVLMVGTGNVASRVFLDNLATELGESFKKKGIESQFSYIGKVDQQTAIRLDTLSQSRYDAFLVFNAANTSKLNMTDMKYVAFGRGMVGTGYGNQFSELYTLTLYNKESMQIMWQGNLTVDFDLADDNKYKTVSKLILNELVKSKVLLN